MILNDLNQVKEKEQAAQKKIVLRCCMAAGCMSSDSKGVKEQLEKAVADAGLQSEVEVRGVGCMKLAAKARWWQWTRRTSFTSGSRRKMRRPSSPR